MTALETEEYVIDRSEFDRSALYQPLTYHGMRGTSASDSVLRVG